MGSPISSITVRSSSVSCPSRTSSMSLPSVFDRSRIRRGKRSKVKETGTMRSLVTSSWMSPEMRPSWERGSSNSRRRASWTRRSIRARPITSSPTRFMSLSRRPISTRTVWLAFLTPSALAAAGAAGFAAAVGAAGAAGFSGSAFAGAAPSAEAAGAGAAGAGAAGAAG